MALKRGKKPETLLRRMEEFLADFREDTRSGVNLQAAEWARALSEGPSKLPNVAQVESVPRRPAG